MEATASRPLGNASTLPVVHTNVLCDGPLCNVPGMPPEYIQGCRYKCTICTGDGVDFCERCESHPDFNHDKTHPLLKFRTPVNSCRTTVLVNSPADTGDRTPDTPTPLYGGPLFSQRLRQQNRSRLSHSQATRRHQPSETGLYWLALEYERANFDNEFGTIARADASKSLFREGTSLEENCCNTHLLKMWILNPQWNIQQLGLPPDRGAWKDYASHAHSKELSFLDILQDSCISTEVGQCSNAGCVAVRKRLEHVVPTCDSWDNLRSWILVFLSCQVSRLRLQERSTREGSRGHGDKIYPGPLTGIVELKLFRARPDMDPGRVCDLIYWALNFIYELDRTPKTIYVQLLEPWWQRDFLPVEYNLGRTQTALEKAREERICPRRLWDVVAASEREHHILPALTELAFPELGTTRGCFHHEGHERCTTEFCQFAHDDNTLKAQPHKCDQKHRGECSPKVFDPSRLNALALEKKAATAWTLDEPPEIYEKDYQSSLRLGEPADPLENSIRDRARRSKLPYRSTGYMAISHVWSDGTGSGRNPGTVNSCLFDWFRQMARSLYCDGIWWDAICMPSDKKARQTAINQMHEYYAGAKVTVIHDQYLLNFKWSEDGSPCLALVLSPWFSRGWTALELNQSKRIKVLYKNPDDSSEELYVIKDLIEDILPTAYATQGHKYAAAIILRIMEPIFSVNDIIAILKTRSTSWPRDRIIIAGLLYPGFAMDSSLSETQITCTLVTDAGVLNPSFLLHGHSTVRETGPFSWCPSSLFQGEVPMRERKQGPESYLTIARPEPSSDNLPGLLVGGFHYRLVDEHNLQQLRPFCLHPSVEWRVGTSLHNHTTCMLLRHPESPESKPSILVTAFGTGFHNGAMPVLWGSAKMVLDCNFVGAVFDDTGLQYSTDTIHVRMGASQALSESGEGVGEVQVSATSAGNADNLVKEYGKLRHVLPSDCGFPAPWALGDWYKMKEIELGGDELWEGATEC